jgi:transcriptional regulator GlxA family with amidase domain
LRIGVAVFDGAEELDWAGPWEVLSAWASGWPDDGVEVFTIAESDGPVRCAKGLRVLADHTWETAPPLDVLVFRADEARGRSSATRRSARGCDASRSAER